MTDRPPMIPNRHKLLIFLAFFLFFFITSSGHFYVVDEFTRYSVTRSMWENGSVNIQDGYGKVGRGGHLYGKYGLFQSAAALPFYAAGAAASRITHFDRQKLCMFSVSVFNQVIMGLTCLLIVIICARNFGLTRRASVATAVIYAVCTMAWQYSRTFFAEPLICLILLLQFLIATDERFKDSGRFAFLLGLLAALNMLTRAETVVYAVLFFFVCCMAPRGRALRAAALYCLAPAAATAFLLWFNLYRYGSLLEFGYAGETFSTPFMQGIYLLLFSTGKGVFFFSPAIVLSSFAVSGFIKKDRRSFWLAAVLALIPLSVYSRWNLPGGDMSWGPRYLLTSVTFMSLGAAAGIKKIVSGRFPALRRAVIAAVLAVSFFVQILSVSVNFHSYYDLLYLNVNPIRATIENINGNDLIYFVPSYSQLNANWQELRFMLDNNYRPALFDDRNNPELKAYLSRYTKPDFTIFRFIKKLRK